MSSFRKLSTMAVFAALAFTGATSVLSYLAAVSATSPGCAGRDSVAGYGVGFLDFLGLPLLSFLYAWAVIGIPRSQRAKDYVAFFDRPSVEFGSLRLTYGEVAVCMGLFCFTVFGALTTFTSAERYKAMSEYCCSAGASR